MQTELMLRLIKDGKIVGYKHITPDWDKTLKMGEIEYTKVNSITEFNAGFMLHRWDCISYDSFELGIKVGDEWWFEGDIVKTDEADWIGHIVFSGSEFIVVDDIGGFCSHCQWENFKRIGNIHED